MWSPAPPARCLGSDFSIGPSSLEHTQVNFLLTRLHPVSEQSSPQATLDSSFQKSRIRCCGPLSLLCNPPPHTQCSSDQLSLPNPMTKGHSFWAKS